MASKQVYKVEALFEELLQNRTNTNMEVDNLSLKKFFYLFNHMERRDFIKRSKLCIYSNTQVSEIGLEQAANSASVSTLSKLPIIH